MFMGWRPMEGKMQSWFCLHCSKEHRTSEQYGPRNCRDCGYTHFSFQPVPHSASSQVLTQGDREFLLVQGIDPD